jgi:hypothetical protein
MTQQRKNSSGGNEKSSSGRSASAKAEPEAVDLDDLAKGVLVALGMWRLPVNPELIAKEEGIELAPGEYGEEFDARIEYIGSARTFILYYRTTAHDRTEGRVRFSQAHELGHYYIPKHRKYLVEGNSHNSVNDFRSRDPREVEADEFASALLMPRDLFFEELKRAGLTKVCALRDLCRLAGGTFRTSVTSTVRRYCQFDWEPCAVVVSEAGRVKWALASDSMRPLGMSYFPFGDPIPTTSSSAKLWQQLNMTGSSEPVEGRVASGVWFERPRREWLWEEAMPLGQTGLVLTFLAADDDGRDDSEDD